MQLEHSTLPLINLEASLGMLLAYRRKAKTISRVEKYSTGGIYSNFWRLACRRTQRHSANPQIPPIWTYNES